MHPNPLTVGWLNLSTSTSKFCHSLCGIFCICFCTSPGQPCLGGPSPGQSLTTLSGSSGLPGIDYQCRRSWCSAVFQKEAAVSLGLRMKGREQNRMDIMRSDALQTPSSMVQHSLRAPPTLSLKPHLVSVPEIRSRVVLCGLG